MTGIDLRGETAMMEDRAVSLRNLIGRAAAEQASVFDALMETRQDLMLDKSYGAMLEALDAGLACLTQMIEAGSIGVADAGGQDIAMEQALSDIYESFLYLR